MVLLDWDAAGRGPAALMAGYPLLLCFVDEADFTFRQDWAAAFYQAYTAGTGMTKQEKEMVFTAALLHALRYLRVHNTHGRWARVVYALEHKDTLLAAIPTREVPAAKDTG